MTGTIVLDIETRSTLDLKKVGHARYAAHPTTDTWCLCYAIDDQPVQLWRPGDPVPVEIATADMIVAHNAGFERAILQHILIPRYGWPEIPLERWRCTMAAALVLALPASLAKVAKALSLTEQKGDKKIVSLMAKPRRPRGNEDPAKIYWFDDPGHREELYRYCEQDVATERELHRRLPLLSQVELALWRLDQVINARGLYVDGELVAKAIAITTAAESAVEAELREITGGLAATQVEKLIAWLAAHDCQVPDLQKATLSQALRRKELAPEVRRVIELRREAAHASASKMQSLRAWRGLDGRARGTLSYHGAGTGRWSSHGPQVQNFRKEADDIAAKYEAVTSGDIETVRRIGPPIEIVGDVARCAICAPPGNKLLTADYSAIESRVLAWITSQQSKLDMWAKFDATGDPNDDPYRVIGAQLGFPAETARAYGKIADLAFGYGGGAAAYRRFSPADDNTPDAVIEGHKEAWRAAHPQTVQFWYGLNRNAVAAVRDAPRTIHYGKLVLRCAPLGSMKFLFIKLPSGREIAYPSVRLVQNDRGHPA